MSVAPSDRVVASRASGLAVRVREPELMDDPELDEADHHRALASLARVHRLSGTGVRVSRVLDDIAGATDADRPIRVLDVACGGGDLAMDVARWGRRRKRDVDVVGFDRSSRALRWAAHRSASQGLRVSWVEGDALEALPEGPFDLACSSLFLHHLSDAEAAHLLGEMDFRANRLLIEDLRRTRLGLLLAHLTLTLLAPSRVARVDGPRSVRAAWSRPELASIADLADLPGVRIRAGWPQRWILTAGTP